MLGVEDMVCGGADNCRQAATKGVVAEAYLAAHEHRKSGESRRARRVKDSGYWIVYVGTDLDAEELACNHRRHDRNRQGRVQ